MKLPARIASLVVVMVLLVATACSSGGTDTKLLDGDDAKAQALMAEYLAEMETLASAAGSLSGDPPKPDPYVSDIERVGTLAYDVATRIKPEDAYEAVTALSEMALEFARRAGGTEHGAGRVVVGPITVISADPKVATRYRKNDLSNPKLQRRQGAVLDRFEAQLIQLATVALLVFPGSRDSLAASPAPIP